MLVLNHVPNGTIATLPVCSSDCGWVLMVGSVKYPAFSSWAHSFIASTTGLSVYLALPVDSALYSLGSEPARSCSNHTKENNVEVWYIGVTPTDFSVDMILSKSAHVFGGCRLYFAKTCLL